MKKLLVLLAATLFMLTSCDLLFGDPEFVGDWTLTQDTTQELVDEMAEYGITLTGVTMETTLDLKLTVDTFEITNTVTFSGDAATIAYFELEDMTGKFAKGNLEYTETQVTLTATHYGDDDTGQTWVAVSGEQADLGTMNWEVSGNTLTLTDDNETMSFTRK